MKFERILWIRQKNHPETYRPILVGIRGKQMHWNAGFTRCPWLPNKFNILKEYSSDELEKAWDELEEEYAPKPQKPCARLGWVSPEGHFYPCAYCCHDELEYILSKNLYDDDYAELKKRGWVALKSGALFSVEYKFKPTQATQDTIRKIVEEFEFAESENPNIDWNSLLDKNPEGYAKQIGWSHPAENLINGPTYAKALRVTYERWFGDAINKQSNDYANIRVRRENEHPGD